MADSIVRVEIDVEKLQRLANAKTGDAAVEWLAQNMVVEIGTGWSSESPSAEGQAPGVDTGALKNSVRASRVREGVWQVTDGVEYGVAHEFGLGVPARPWMVPAFERVRGRAGEAFTVVIEGELK